MQNKGFHIQEPDCRNWHVSYQREYVPSHLYFLFPACPFCGKSECNERSLEPLAGLSAMARSVADSDILWIF
jgi:hypothetical protein